MQHHERPNNMEIRGRTEHRVFGTVQTGPLGDTRPGKGGAIGAGASYCTSTHRRAAPRALSDRTPSGSSAPKLEGAVGSGQMLPETQDGQVPSAPMPCTVLTLSGMDQRAKPVLLTGEGAAPACDGTAAAEVMGRVLCHRGRCIVDPVGAGIWVAGGGDSTGSIGA